MATSDPEFKRTILLGLGGAGKLILTYLKRLFLDQYNVLPPSVKLLVLDTDPSAVALRSSTSRKEYSLSDQEMLYMKVAQPREFIDASSVVKDWFIAPAPAGSIDNGAGAVRQNGRLAFFYHINNFKRRIDSLWTELSAMKLPCQQMENAKIELGARTNFRLSTKSTAFYVCGSLAGGTGSGCFLDVGILLRELVPDALIYGFFLLNWIYRNKAFAYRVQGNMYAALAELDNIQSIMYGAKDFVPYQMTYADLIVKVKNPPYNLVNLIDGRNEVGENINDVEELCEGAANAIFLSISAMGEPVDSVVDNLVSHINVQNPRVWNGRFARYSSFGVSSIYYPAEELHRLVSLGEAYRMCESALSEVRDKKSAKEPSAPAIQQADRNDVHRLLGADQLNLLNRTYVQDKICPFQTTIAMPVKPFQISDKLFPKLIQSLFQKEETKLEQTIDQSYQNNGSTFIEDIRMVLDQKISEIKKDPTLDTAYLRGWIDDAVGLISAQKDEATRALNQELDQISNHRKNADELLALAKKARYIPALGGPRKSQVANWIAQVVQLLNSIKTKKRLEYEKQCYEQILEILRSRRPELLPPSKVMHALEGAKEVIGSMFGQERNNLKILLSKPNHIVVGYGNIVVVRGKENDISTVDSIRVDYDEFKKDKNLYRSEDYAKDPKELVSLFLDYCSDKLENIKKITLHEAMEAIGNHRGDKDAYIKEQFNHLFRLSAPLWSYSEGRINEVQRLQYDKIVNFGVYEKEEGIRHYNQFVLDLKVKYGIRADHTFSTTGDNQRIWILDYAAALPVYFLSDVEQNKRKYEEEITPTYHIDRYLEMNVPDLFPVDDIVNRGLRVLGMAIVPGTDVIRDEKLTKGHRFTLDAGPVREKNFGEPMTWYLFRDMYDEVTEDYDPEKTDNLLDILTDLLKEKVRAIPQSELRKYIEAHMRKLTEKLDSRDFSRLVSARLTYREIRELEKFLNSRGYAMDIDRYLAGK